MKKQTENTKSMIGKAIHKGSWRGRYMKSAFTLIELIVVMAVIGILVLLAAPKFLGYTERAQFTKDVQTAKVLETAIEAYLINGGRLEGELEVADITLIKESATANNVLGVDGFIEDIETSIYYELTHEFIRDKLDVKISRNNTLFIQAMAGKPRAAYVTDSGKALIDRNRILTGFTESTPSEPGEPDEVVVTEPEVEWPPTEPIAPVTPEGYFTFDPTSKTITKFYPTGVNGTLEKITDVVIPATIGGVDVNILAVSSFASSELTSVFLPSNVKTVGSYAFLNNKISTLTIEDGVQSISNYAFKANTITSVNIPESMVSMGIGVFEENALSAVRIPSSLRGASPSISTFQGATLGTVHIYKGPAADNLTNLFSIGSSNVISIDELVIEEGVTTLEDYLFRNVRLTQVTLPESLTTIKSYVFIGSGLTEISIPNSVTIIGAYAFSDNKLTAIRFPNQLTVISEAAFRNNNLINITIPKHIETVGNLAFLNNKISTLTIEDGVQSISNYAFKANTITSVNIPESMVSMGIGVFDENALSAVRIPSSTRGISSTSSTFRDTTLDTVHIYKGPAADNLTNLFSIGSSNVISIDELVIEEGVTTLEDYLFRNVRLTQVTLPESLTTIKSYVFIGSGLTEISIPNSVTIIGAYAFSYNKLTTIKLPTNLTTLGTSAFYKNGPTSSSTSNISTIVNDVKGKTFNMVNDIWTE